MVDALTLEESHGRFSVSEFEEYLNVDYLSSREHCYGWVFWRPDRVDQEASAYGSNNSSVSQVYQKSIQERIRLALDDVASRANSVVYEGITQFWAPNVIEGRFCLTTLDQPFALGYLDKRSCRYRMQCMNHYYDIDNGAEEEQVGPPGRAFRNGHPESTPDLRLYSIKQFPLRDQATCFGFRMYLALPVFDLCQKQCVGVLEFVSSSGPNSVPEFILFLKALQKVGLTSTHGSFNPIYVLSNSTPVTEDTNYMIKPLREIMEMLALAIEVVPQLHLAQVWVPCDGCTNPSNHLSCMKRLAYINAENETSPWNKVDNILEFLNAGGFHNVQVGKGIAGIVFSSMNKLCFCRNLSGLSITEYPLAHYAQIASLSFVFSICLQSMNNGNKLCIFEFYLHSHSRDDVHTWSLLHLLLKIMEMKLKSFKAESGRQLGDELIVEVCNKNMLTFSGQEPLNVSPLGYEIIQHGQAKRHQYLKEFSIVMPMERCNKMYSIFDFKAFLNESDLFCLETPTAKKYGWAFCSRRVLLEVKYHNSLLLPNQIQEKIITFFRVMTSRWELNKYCLVQFWAPKMVNGKSCLSTSEQPFALSFLCKGLSSYRKQCMEHHYFVGEGAKEEELGPLGRVFRTGHRESSPDIRLYSIKEFPLRDHAVHCGLRRYLALPVFDSNQMQCVGILECVELRWHNWFSQLYITRALEEANLLSTHLCFWSRILKAFGILSIPINDGGQKALREIEEMLSLVIQAPELHLAQAWIPCFKCANKSDDRRCMEWASNRGGFNFDCFEFNNMNEAHQVQIGKGVAGMALGSENRSCFCRNLCDFSITEQHLAHYAQRSRLDICFAICLQSSYTSNALYVLEFFLKSGVTQGRYAQSLIVLLEIMKKKLKSFKVASGQQLGEELVVDVIESHQEKKLSESTYVDSFPIKFNFIQYSQEMEHEHSRNKQVHSDHNGMNDGMNISEAKQSDAAAANANKEVTTNKTKRSRKETSFHIDLGDLEPRFGNKLEDVARELGVGKSTIKRACRRYGIARWPGKKQKNMNPSFYREENAANQVQDIDAETSISSGTNNPPLDLAVCQNKPHTNTESTQQLAKISRPETDMMMVKAKFNDDTMKFQIRISSGMEKLKEEVGKRLNLIGRFKLKYLDEGDDEWILLGCEDDLQLCVKTLTALGKTCVQVLVQLISP